MHKFSIVALCVLFQDVMSSLQDRLSLRYIEHFALALEAGGWSRTSGCICCRRISLCHTYARQKEPDPSSIHHPHTLNIKAVDKTNVVQWQKMTTMNMMVFFSFPDD